MKPVLPLPGSPVAAIPATTVGSIVSRKVSFLHLMRILTVDYCNCRRENIASDPLEIKRGLLLLFAVQDFSDRTKQLFRVKGLHEIIGDT